MIATSAYFEIRRRSGGRPVRNRAIHYCYGLWIGTCYGQYFIAYHRKLTAQPTVGGIVRGIGSGGTKAEANENASQNAITNLNPASWPRRRRRR